MQIDHQKQSRLLPQIGLVFALLAMVLLPPVVAGAENEAAEETPPVAEAKQAQQASAEPEADTGTTQSVGEQSAPATGAKARPVKPFKPSETIGADSAVSFPIDI